MSVAVLVATRDRPEQAYELLQSFFRTKSDHHTTILFGVDHDEPQMDLYRLLVGPFMMFDAGPESGSLTTVTNAMARNQMNDERITIMGSVGDDHRFRTSGWDESIKHSMGAAGVIYPDDGFQGQNLATAFFMHADVVRGLGWLALPVCDHMYIDNAAMDVGRELGYLKYLPHVRVEHLHPAAGKGIMDESYRRTNAVAQMSKDRKAYEKWKRLGLPEDVSKVREYISGPQV